MTTRCGYVALLGRPNAGKSTLLNAMIGDKIAVVSRKPQTTRNRILGLTIAGESQIMFLDTPGLHRAKGKDLINTAMNRVAMQVSNEADVIVFMVDITQGFTEQDEKFLSRILAESSAPFILLASKADAIKKHERASSLAGISLRLEAFLRQDSEKAHTSRLLQPDPIPLSGKRPEEVTELKDYLAELLPESPWLYPEDDLTDMPRSFLVAELIREQIFRQLGKEVPYSTAVTVDDLKFKNELVVIQANIVVNRSTHKGIVLGKGGAQIKAIGTAARESLAKHFGSKVFLELSVSVAEKWTEDPGLLSSLAYLTDDSGASAGQSV